MSNKLKISGPIIVGSLASDPSNPQNGLIYYNTSSNEFRQYVNGSFQKIVDQSVIDNLVASDIAYERADGSKKNIQASSDTVEPALDDLDDAIGALEASPSNYTPTDASIVADHLAGIDSALATAGNDENVKVSANDTTAGFLEDKIVVSDGTNSTNILEVSTLNDGGDEDLQIQVDQSKIDHGSLAGLGDDDHTQYILVDGTRAFSGDQAMGSNKITGLADGTDAADAVNKGQLDLKADDADVIKKDGSVDFTADQSMGGFKLTNLAAPTAGTDAATKTYVDSVAEGLRPKEAVRAASTANVDISTELENGDSLDGVTLATGDRVLLKDQTAAETNGIYVVVASGAASRATDFDSLTPIDEINGAYVPVQEGTANAGKVFVQQGTVSTLGTDAINFVFFNSTSGLVGGDGITVSGSNISVDQDGEGLTFVSNQLALELDGGTLSKSASGVKVADLGVDTAQLADSAVTDAKVAAGIDAVKIGSGDVDNTEFGYLNGVTSAIQTQLDAKLENVVEDTTPELGGDLEVGGNAIEGASSELVLAGQNSVRRAKQASKSSFVEEEYLHALSLSASQTDTAITALTFAHATYEGVEVVYKVKEATSNDVEIGTLRVVTNGTDVVLNNVSTETAPTGITFSAAINGSNVEIRYSSGSNGATMRADVKRFLA